MSTRHKETLCKKENWKDTREGFGKGLLALGEKNPRVVALTADLTTSTRANLFRDKFPDRFFQFGVAEQNMMNIAAGMSLCGYIPYVCTYGVFSAGRCWEQLRLSVCYQDCNVKIEGAHSGLLVGPDGATHQALEDIGLTRIIPNLKVIVPCDSREAYKATLASADIPGPVYIRVGREKVPVITDAKTPFILGKASILRQGKDVAIIACGVEVCESLLAAEELKEEGVDVCVVNLHTIKPVDKETIIKVAKATGAIVTAEEHQLNCGLGSLVSEVLCQNYPVPVEMVGIKDRFGESGQPWDLMKEFGLMHDEIVEAIKRVLKRKLILS